MRRLLCLVLLLLSRAARADWSDLTVAPGTVTNVWGFCQGGLAAPVAGGWVNNASGRDAAAVAADIAAVRRDGTCHMGMSGTYFSSSSSSSSPSSSSNFSLMPNNTCALTAAAAAHTCNCIGVPQCGRGSKCSFDCSCDVLALRNASTARAAGANATLPRMLADPDARPIFVGSIKFKDGKDFDVACALPLGFRNATAVAVSTPPAVPTSAGQVHNQTKIQQYLHGYEILIRGVGGWDRRCPDSESKPPAEQPLTMHSRYECAVTPILADRPLVVGDVFQQKYVFSWATSRGVARWLAIVVGIGMILVS
jgi:hypothetical protein